MTRLPRDFTFGVSTASYQIEGAVDADGRGRSIWDDFCDRPGAIRDSSSGQVACDSYHRYDEDLTLMSELGVDAYRFSVAWPRVIPEGSGVVNQAGLDHYDRLVDALCAKGIKPCVTLYHWDLPSPLEAEGGWLSRETAQAFGDYTRVVVERLGDRVSMWIPVNEPNVHATLGYATGDHAPGREMGLYALPAMHHLLLAHGLATMQLRASGATMIGTATNHQPIWAATDSEADQGAAQLCDALYNRMFAEPMLLGRYPEGFAEMLPGPVAQDLEIIQTPLDFYGLNYYNPMLVGVPSGNGVHMVADVPFETRPLSGYPVTDFDWPVVPAGLTEMIMQLTQRYAGHLPPLYVTENGCAYNIRPDATGRVADADRIAYYESHLAAVADARDAGADVRGYFAWSLLDNFEWAEGYTQRFGLVDVDFETLARTPKDSFAWFADYIKATRGA